MFIKLLTMFAWMLSDAFLITIRPLPNDISFELSQYDTIAYDNDIVFYWDKEYLYYSDNFHNITVQNDTLFEGVCGLNNIVYDSNDTSLNGYFTYFSECNITDYVYWVWYKHSLCNSTNKICKPIHVNDVFHIDKRSYQVYDIQNTSLIYEEIAYIRPELWAIAVLCMCVCCFGVHTYNVAGSKIVT